MKACGLIGSPIRGGNVDVLVGQVLEGASSCGVSAKKILLNELSIRPCQSCGPNQSSEPCCYKDDMQQVYEALAESDIVVLGSPVYFDTVSAQAKLMIDRCNCLTALVEEKDGSVRFEKRFEKRKTGLLVAVAGSGQDFSSIRATATGFFAWINADTIPPILYAHDGSEKGSVRSDSHWMREAFDAGVFAACGHTSPRDS